MLRYLQSNPSVFLNYSSKIELNLFLLQKSLTWFIFSFASGHTRIVSKVKGIAEKLKGRFQILWLVDFVLLT